MPVIPTSTQHAAQNIISPTVEQWRTIYFIIGYAVGISVLWHMPYLQHLLFPFKLVTVAFHEFGHAAAGKLTGAKVEGITVDPNEGGVTHMRGGRACCTLPAGYIGSAVFGGLMIFAGFEVLASSVVAIIVGLSLLATLFWAKSWLTRGITVGFTVILIGLRFVPKLGGGEEGYYLRYFLLFMGVMSALYSLWDIIDDLVLRKANGSDAVQMTKQFGGYAQCWGVLWFLVSLVFVLIAVFAALIIFHENPPS